MIFVGLLKLFVNRYQQSAFSKQFRNCEMFWEGRLLFFCHFPYYAGLTQTVRFSEKLILNLQCRTRFREMFYESFTQCR